MTTTAKIAAKGTKSTGLTETHAKRLHDNLGKTIIAIVEITSEARTENKAGDEQVKLSLGMIEVAPDGLAAEHVRELARSFHYERQLADGQPTLDEGSGEEPTVAGVIAAGQSQRPHPFLADDASKDNPICDVCGLIETAPRHSVQDQLEDEPEAGTPAAANDDEPDLETCPTPSCELIAEHDGDHHPEAPPTIPSPFTTPGDDAA